MKYYLLNGFRKDLSISETPEMFAKHQEYWDRYFKDGTVLIAGPKMKGSGLIIIRCESEEKALFLAKGDPFVTDGGQDYVLEEFRFVTGDNCVKEWFNPEV